MLLVGLTGGLASGKSYVAEIFAELGCHIIHADALGHETLLPTGDAYASAIAEFGLGILNADQTINRKALADIVFTDPEKLAKLNAIVHPAVGRLQQARIAGIVAEDPHAIILAEAAIHIETGNYKRYQKLILVVCSEEQQIARAMARDNATREQVQARLARQMPLQEKRKFADYVIDTSGSTEATRAQTAEVYNSLRGI